MRKKLLVDKDRVRRPICDFDPDEVNGDYSSERTVRDEPGENNERERAEDGSEGGDFRRKKRRTLGGTEAGENVDRLKADACIVCDREDDQVLVCHEAGCPVALHERCMSIKPDFDEFGNFYCAYCSYKRQVIRFVELKEETKAVEKALAYEKAEKVKTNTETENVLEVNPSLGRRRNHSHFANIKGHGESHNQIVELENDPRSKAGVSEIGEFEVPKDGERKRKKDPKWGEGSGRERIAKDEWKRIKEEKEIEGFDMVEDGERIQEPQNVLCEYEQMMPSASPTISSPLSTNGSDGCNLNAHGNALVVRQKLVVQAITEEAPHYNTASWKKASFRSGKYSIENRSNQGNSVTAYNPSTRRKNILYHDGKRKRLYWTPEEENMLKIGVEKFSNIANKNMPWRKILEFGQHVFHEERTPTDLKDKWKNMNKPA